MPVSEKIKLLHSKRLNSHAFVLSFEAPEIAKSAKPGQFLMLESAVYLKRPYGIMSVDRARGTIELGIDLVGRGSKNHSQLRPGSRLTALGPLGQGFKRNAKVDNLILVGGGSGIYPLLFAAEENRDSKILTVLGFRSAENAVLAERFRSAEVNLILSSDTGGLDFHGNAVAALRAELARKELESAEVWACGPLPMLKAVAELARERNFSCQLSFEARMACGVGFCSGCAIPIKNSLPQRCCFEGPVFPAELIDWETVYA